MNCRKRIHIMFLVSMVIVFNGLGQQNFVNVAESIGVSHHYGLNLSGGGVSFADFNNDGWDDLSFATSEGQPIHFYQNTGGQYQRILIPSIQNLESTKQLLWADYDNDGDQDLYVSSFNFNRLYQNQGNLNFVDVSITAGLGLVDQQSFGAAWGDFNLDGWIDLYVTHKIGDTSKNELFENQGDGSFVDIAQVAGVEDTGKKPFCVGFLDYNNDRWPDIYIAQDRQAINTFFKNNGDGTFTDVSQVSGADLKMDGMSVAVADINADGFLDIYITNIEEGNRLLLNNGDETFMEIADIAGVGFYAIAWGASFLDHDNDMDNDLYVSGQEVGTEVTSSAFYENTGNTTFTQPVDIGFEGDTVISYSNAVGDFNKDGFSDIAVNNFNDYSSFVWENSGNDNHWIGIHLTGTSSNRDAVGTWVEVYANDIKQVYYSHIGSSYLGQDSKTKILGLGNTTLVDSIKFIWPSGKTDLIKSLSSNQFIEVFEGSTSVIPEIMASKLILCGNDSIILDAGWHDTYAWNTGETTRELVVKTEGTFNVTTTDDGIMNLSDDITISNPNEALNVSFAITDATCNGAMDGAIEITNPENESLMYFWSNGENNQHIETIGAGQYTVDIIRENGCLSKFDLIVEQPDSLKVEVSQTAFNRLEAIASGGIPPYIFNWNDPEFQTGPVAENLGAGNYVVFVTDSNGCETNENVELEPVTGNINQSRRFIQVYPVPAKDNLIIRSELKDITNVYLTDLKGSKFEVLFYAENKNKKNQITIATDFLEAGIYILHLNTKRQYYQARIIIE